MEHQNPQQGGVQSRDEFLNALKTDDYDKVRELIHLSSECFGKERTSSLIIAARYSGAKVVRLLLQTDSSLLSRKDGRNREPAFVAAAYGNEECLKILLDAGVSVDTKYEAPSEDQPEEEDLIEPMVVPECSGRSLLHEAAYYGMDKCMAKIVEKFDENQINPQRFTLKERNRDVELMEEEEFHPSIDEKSWKNEQYEFFERKDEEGSTALDLALLGINKVRQQTENPPRGWVKCISILLKRSASYFVKNCNEKKRTTILDVPVELLKEVFDEQIRYKDKRTITIDFSMICPKSNDYLIMYEFLENASLAKDDRQVVFRHPLMRAFVRERWQCICNLFYSNVILYVLHVLSLSAFVTMAHCDVFYFGRDWRYATARQGLPIARYVLVSTTVMVSLNVVWLSYLTKRYRWKIEMWINFSSCILSLLVVGFTDIKGDSMESTTNASVLRPKTSGWVIHFTCLSVLMAWLELNLLVGRFPRWGAHALLFFPVLLNVCKVLVTYGCMILGFSFVFFLEFRQYDPSSFGDPLRAFIKTMVMMMGEFDYSNMFKGENEESFMWEASTLPFFSRIIFLGFVVMASIALMNLMVGLAVSDTQELKLKSLETQLMKRAQSLLQWGYFVQNLPGKIRGFFVRYHFVKTDDLMVKEMEFDRRHHFPEELMRSLRVIAEKKQYESKKKRALKVVRRHLLPLDGSVNLPNEVLILLNAMYEKVCALSEEKQEDIDEHFLSV